MTILVSGGEKGGTGKTMLATSLAVCFAERGKDVLLVDADGQGSATRWAQARAQMLEQPGSEPRPKRIPWVVLNGNTYHALRDLERRYEIVIVDAGGADSEEFRSAITTANAVYTCVVPSDCDLGTLPQVNAVIGAVRDLGRTDLIARVVLNLCSNHPAATDVEEARAFVAEHAPLFQCASSIIHHRDPFKQSYKGRITVTEAAAMLDRRGRQAAQKAADEVWRLFGEIAREVGVDVPDVHAVPPVPEVQQVQGVHE